MITLNQILARLTVDYDKIHFWYCGEEFDFNYVVSNFDLDYVFVHNIFLDVLDGYLSIEFIK